jgi:hypothetical protein
MIVICITNVWETKGTSLTNDWCPVKDNLYEVVASIRNSGDLYYKLREQPDPQWIYEATGFREIDINISDLEKVEELELTS